MSAPTITAWVNWNPDPLIHAYGTTMPTTRNTVIALCRVTVREHVGDFDPTHPKACPDCAGFVTAGLGWSDVKDRKPEYDPVTTIVCKRPAR